MHSLILFVTLFSSLLSFAQTIQAPQIFFDYSKVYDGVACKNSVNPLWVEEAGAREAELQALWNKDSPALFQELFKKFPVGFSRKELTGTFSVCHRHPSYNNPLVINVTPLLKSFAQEFSREQYPDYAFIDLVFHEMLHTWLKENFVRDQALMEKYKTETPEVLNHIVLMALQKYAYHQLGRTDLEEWMDKRYSSMSADYKRSWEIVKIEGYQNLVDALKQR